MKIEAVKAVIFDLDGTLVHTKPGYRYFIVGKALSEFGREVPNSQIDDFWFLSDKDRERIIREIWNLNPDKQFWPVYRGLDQIELRRQYTEPYDDVCILQVLRGRNIKTGIVSSAPAHIINLELEMLKHDFGSVVRAQPANQVMQKPHPEGLLKCICELRTEPSKTIYVGNSRGDMEMARNARVYGVLVERGEYDFGKIEADLTISSLEELKDLV